MGICSSELQLYGISKDDLLPITKYDERKALAMLQQDGDTLPSQWRKELLHMLHTRRKAEIEILANSPSSPAPTHTIQVSTFDLNSCSSVYPPFQAFHEPPLIFYVLNKLQQAITQKSSSEPQEESV
ncbi:hypothetical protein DL96DRAFT_1175854 [Flagelloscypha sp. PMI_526]|nr:hypothetical protein DL96DRAFT_1175854 [Flagelloscypha sp. PMI_526]